MTRLERKEEAGVVVSERERKDAEEKRALGFAREARCAVRAEKRGRS